MTGQPTRQRRPGGRVEAVRWAGLVTEVESATIAAVHLAAATSTGQPPDLREHYLACVRLANDTGAAVHGWVAHARRFGASWSDIGAQLMITRQAAHERFRYVFADDYPAHAPGGAG